MLDSPVAQIIIPFVGGLGLFIYGMQIMAQGLQNAVGSRMKKLLEVLTKNKLMGLLLGAGITAIIQSSSATTVMVVGFVNAGIMNLVQATSVIMGANIGTTVTAWIVSSGEWAKFFSPTVIAPIVVMIGVAVLITAKKPRTKDISSIIIGFGILFIGIETMSNAVYPLRESKVFTDMCVTLGHQPILAIFAGFAITAIIQSSSASLGILQSLAAVGLVPFSAAVYIIMGQNIGTCVTALLSSIGANKNAKSAAYIHLLFNVIGTIIFSIVAIIIFKVFAPNYATNIISQTEISIVHTSFNIATTILLFPFSNAIIKIAEVLTQRYQKKGADDAELVHLDDRVLETPSLAVESAVKEVIRLGNIVKDSLNDISKAIKTKSSEAVEKMHENEETIDKLSDAITNYLVKIFNTHVNDTQSSSVTALIKIVSDLERIGDHCENIGNVVENMINNDVNFSDEAHSELSKMIDKAYQSVYFSVISLKEQSIDYARMVARLENDLDGLQIELRNSHVERLANKVCTAEAGILFLDVITSYERISDHALNIVQVVVEECGHCKEELEESYVPETN